MIMLLLALQLSTTPPPLPPAPVPVYNVATTAPPLTPAQAAAILANGPSLANAALLPSTPAPVPAPTGPTITLTGSTGPTLGPWDWPAPLPATRLDGTPLSQPPAVYGMPYPWLSVPIVAIPVPCQTCNQPDSGQKGPGR